MINISLIIGIKTFINPKYLTFLSASESDSREQIILYLTDYQINMKTKTRIDKQLERKNNSELVQTIIEAKKKKNWLDVAGILSSPKINRINMNLNTIDTKAKDGETVVVPGKVLSQGEISKKIKIIAFSFSEKAKEKILKAKGEISTISEEIKKNPDAKGIKILGKKE